LCGKAKAQGLKVGAYHFLHVGEGYSVDREAGCFLAQLRGLQPDCRPAIDIEEAGYHGGDPAAVTAQVLEFAEKVTAASGLPCMVYADTSFIGSHFTKGITKLPLWIADYRSSSAPGENGITGSWAGLQYADNGSVGGCTVDLDEFTEDVLLNRAQQPAASKAPAFPGAEYFGPGRANDFVLMLDRQLIKRGYSKYYLLGRLGASRSWGGGTQKACRAFQLSQGWKGTDADGIPGPETWSRLFS
ncbi:MAG: peptidoglycan-binding protein, partial [Clostridia bacterium]|nr:peptidoglycan-binding protein [Clostridia bacterium]